MISSLLNDAVALSSELELRRYFLWEDKSHRLNWIWGNTEEKSMEFKGNLHLFNSCRGANTVTNLTVCNLQCDDVMLNQFCYCMNTPTLMLWKRDLSSIDMKAERINIFISNISRTCVEWLTERTKLNENGMEISKYLNLIPD